MRHLHLPTFTLLTFTLLGVPVHAGVALKGSGSTLAAPLFLKFTSEYQATHPGMRLKYEVKNPTDAINQFLGRGSDFAVTDTPFTSAEEKKTIGRTVFHLPVALQAVVITYNLPGVPSGIKLTPALLSKIFIGTIKKWNDPGIREINNGTIFPDMDIQVIHREEESSMHDLFPSFLARQDPKWILKHEKDKNLKWPVGKNVRGNEKVMEKLRKWPGVIAAVDFTYGTQNHLPMAEIKNASDHFAAPTPASLAAGAGDWVNLPENFNVSLGRSRSPEAYPLCTFSWLLVYEDSYRATHNHDRSKALVDFLNWIFSDGQKLESDLSFVPLPDSFLSQVIEKVKSIRF